MNRTGTILTLIYGAFFGMVLLQAIYHVRENTPKPSPNVILGEVTIGDKTYVRVRIDDVEYLGWEWRRGSEDYMSYGIDWFRKDGSEVFWDGDLDKTYKKMLFTNALLRKKYEESSNRTSTSDISSERTAGTNTTTGTTQTKTSP